MEVFWCSKVLWLLQRMRTYRNQETWQSKIEKSKAEKAERVFGTRTVQVCAASLSY